MGTMAGSGNGGPDDDAAVDAEEEDVGQDLDATSRKRKGGGEKGPVCWSTYKYRPILGIVPIGVLTEGDGEVVDGNDQRALGHGEDPSNRRPWGMEVAIVERPLWDIDLPPRYYGDQEWDK